MKQVITAIIGEAKAIEQISIPPNLKHEKIKVENDKTAIVIVTNDNEVHIENKNFVVYRRVSELGHDDQYICEISGTPHWNDSVARDKNGYIQELSNSTIFKEFNQIIKKLGLKSINP